MRNDASPRQDPTGGRQQHGLVHVCDRARLSQRHALLLGAGLWVGLFGLELIVLPPWSARVRRY